MDVISIKKESDDKKMKAKDDQDGLSAKTFVFVVPLKRAVLNGTAKYSRKSRFPLLSQTL